MAEKSNDRLKAVLFLAVAFLMLACGFWIVRDMAPIADENLHYQQIMGILDGSNYFPSRCPYLPGYHWTMACLCMLVRSVQGTTLRFLATFLSFLSVISFFSLAKKIDPDTAVRKSFLFLLFPLFFPFFPLIYTDIYSMTFVFLALIFALNGRLWLSGIVGILGLLVRQNNIIWFLFVAMVAYFENCPSRDRWKDAKRWIPKFSFFFLAVILTAAFVIWNKGFVLGDKTHHALSLTCGNLFFLLFLFFFLFLPFNLSNFPKIMRFLKAHKLMWLVLAEVFLFYFLFFRADHPYNQMGRFFRNWLLWDMLRSPLNKCLYFLPIACSILSLCVTPLMRRSFYLLYPFTVLFLIPLPLIEIRYGFIPLALFLLFKGPDSKRVTIFTLATYVVPIAILIYSMKTAAFFP
jgi:alpha-1,2-glucosyltransferase